MRTSIKLKSYKFQFRHFIALKQLWRCTRLHVMYAYRRLPSHCLFIYVKCFWAKELQNFQTLCPTNSDTIVSAFIITIRHSEYAPNYSDVTWAPTHRQINCFYNSLLRLISKKTSKLHITGASRLNPRDFPDKQLIIQEALRLPRRQNA